MAVEKAKSIQTVSRLHARYQIRWISIMVSERHSQRYSAIGIADEVQIKGFTVAGQSVKGIDVGFKEIGPLRISAKTTK
jgi:hypothetical protein